MRDGGPSRPSAKGKERDRRPTQDELDRLIAHFEGKPLRIAPVSRTIRFAVATAMRQDEICSVRWSDIGARTKMLTIRDRKDPRNKAGNHQRIPLFAATGYDAWALVEEQRAIRSNEDDRIFPYNGRSIGTAFRRGCCDLEIDDLHFHDLRHEGTSRLFEAGFTIEQVARHRPHGLEDAPPVHSPQARGAARAGGRAGSLNRAERCQAKV